MNFQRTFSSAFVFSTVLALSACGGGSGGSSSSGFDSLPALASTFASQFTSGLSSLNASAGLNSRAVPDLFDARYLDGGFTRADVSASLTANAQALGTSPDLSLFPTAGITNAVLTGCDTNGICTLNATLTNSDAETTTVNFSTRVAIINGQVYLYGDQSSTTSI
jgi:hypothetical protein